MKKFSLKNKILLNSARNCLRYIVRVLKITEMHLPYYICPVVWQSLREEHVKIRFYHVNEKFMPTKDFSPNDYILYPNYFGICTKQNKILSSMYKNLISDNAHAFFAPNFGRASFSSPRKFFKVNDGGVLTLNADSDLQFEQDLDRNIEIVDYETFCKNELSIDNQPIKFMSRKTSEVLKNMDFERQIVKKRMIYQELNEYLKEKNILNADMREDEVPVVYPFLPKNIEESAEIAKKLENEKVYLIKYGSNISSKFTESFFQKNLLMIPLINNSLKIMPKKINKKATKILSLKSNQ